MVFTVHVCVCVFVRQIDATDVLSAMGAIPSGFRPSTLNKLLVEEGHYTHIHVHTVKQIHTHLPIACCVSHFLLRKSLKHLIGYKIALLNMFNQIKS